MKKWAAHTVKWAIISSPTLSCRMTANGDLRMCLQSKNGTGLRERLRNRATDEELVELFQKSVEQKPAGHQMSERKIEAEGMYQIGG